MDEHFDPDEIDELLAQERQKQGLPQPKEKAQPSTRNNSVEEDYVDPGMDMDPSDLPLSEPKPTKPNPIGVWFNQQVAGWKHKQHQKTVQKAKKELQQSRKEMHEASKDIEKMTAPKTHADNVEDKMIAREKKAQKKLGAAAAPIVLDTDHLNNTPPAKPNQRLITPPNTKVYTAIVVGALVLGVVVFRPYWVGNAWDGVGSWFKSKPEQTPVVEQPITPPVAPVETPVAQSAPEQQVPVAGPNGLPPPPPPPPTALPGEVPNYSNFEVPKNLTFDKPTQASVERAQAAAPAKEKRQQKTQEQLQEEQERKMIEEQMKKLDAWGNR